MFGFESTPLSAIPRLKWPLVCYLTRMTGAITVVKHHYFSCPRRVLPTAACVHNCNAVAYDMQRRVVACCVLTLICGQHSYHKVKLGLTERCVVG